MSETKYYAHTKTNPDGAPAPQKDWQPLKDHLQNAAALARRPPKADAGLLREV